MKRIVFFFAVIFTILGLIRCNERNSETHLVSYSSLRNNFQIYSFDTSRQKTRQITYDMAGLHQELDGWIYYIRISSIFDTITGPICKMNTNTKSKTFITQDDSKFFIIQGEWIYYIKMSSFDSSIFKTKIDGTSESKITNDNAYSLRVYNDWIYYSNQDDNFSLYKIRTDGSERTKLNNDRISPSSPFTMFFLDNWIYYSNQDDNFSLYKIRTDGSERTKLNNEGSFFLTSKSM